MGEFTDNVASISGKIVSEYVDYHKKMGEQLLAVQVEVVRQSGQVDILPVVISEKLLSAEIKSAPYVRFEGQIRTYNKSDGSVETFIFARDAEVSDSETFENKVSLKGFLCKKGRYRETGSGRKVIDFILAVNRHFSKSDYLAILAWGKDSKFILNKEISSELVVTGRFQSRNYSKKIDGKSIMKVAYEVSPSQILDVQK